MSDAAWVNIEVTVDDRSWSGQYQRDGDTVKLVTDDGLVVFLRSSAQSVEGLVRERLIAHARVRSDPNAERAAASGLPLEVEVAGVGYLCDTTGGALPSGSSDRPTGTRYWATSDPLLNEFRFAAWKADNSVAEIRAALDQELAQGATEQRPLVLVLDDHLYQCWPDAKGRWQARPGEGDVISLSPRGAVDTASGIQQDLSRALQS